MLSTSTLPYLFGYKMHLLFLPRQNIYQELSGLIDKEGFLYLGKIVVAGAKWEEHHSNLAVVLAKLVYKSISQTVTRKVNIWA